MPIYNGHTLIILSLLRDILLKKMNPGEELPRPAPSSMPPARAHARATLELEQRIDRLTILCAAMWEVVKENTSADDERLLRIAEAVDQSDGRLDGKVRHPPTPCPACKRMIGQRRRVCMYCGKQIARPPFSSA